MTNHEPTKNKDKDSKKAAALKYDIDKDQAPQLIAKGKGDLAKKIIKKAREENIPLKRRKDIIDILLQLELGEEIPREIYQVIAEVLSFIYQLEETEQ